METFLAVLVSVYLVMIVAEFGDKTNLIALSLMSKNNPYRVALFATIGIGLSTVFSVLIGALLGVSFRFDYIRYGAALVFIWLGVSSLLKEGEDGNNEAEENRADEEKNNSNEVIDDEISVYRIMYLIALAELGDKSQIFAITAAASTFPLAVLIGSTLGMATIMFLTAILGSLFLERIDTEKLEKFAAILFILAGLWIGISTLLE